MIKNSISYFMRLLRMFFSCKHCHFTKVFFFNVELKHASLDYNAVVLGSERVAIFYVILFLINLMYTEDGIEFHIEKDLWNFSFSVLDQVFYGFHF